MAAVILGQISDYPYPTVTVEYDGITKVLPIISSSATSVSYLSVLGQIPPDNFNAWENKTYTLKMSGNFIADIYRSHEELRGLPIPDEVTYDLNNRTVCWSPVSGADTFRARILNSTDVDDLLYQSGSLPSNTSCHQFPAAYQSVLDDGCIVAVESRQWVTLGSEMQNTSVYVTRTPDICQGDFDEDGDADGSDLANFRTLYTENNMLADLDYNNDVDENDIKKFAQDYGRANCPIQSQ
jgi:hypothetical protein